MATKRYVSPSSFKEGLQDNFRKFMGQYWLRDLIGVLVYGENVKTLEIPDINSSIPPAPTEVLITSDNPYELQRTLLVSRLKSSLPEVEYGLYHSSVSSTNEPIVRSELYLKIEGDVENYPSLQSFSDELKEIFKNPTVNGVEDYFYEESFLYEMPDVTDFSSNYNYAIEEYENLISSLPESALPNIYTLSSVSEAGLDLRFQLYPEVQDHMFLFSNEWEVEGSLVLTDLGSSGEYTDYFKEWANRYVNLSFENANNLEKRGKNVIKPEDTAANFEPISSKVPFHINVKFPGESRIEISDTINGSVLKEDIYTTIFDLDLFNIFIAHVDTSIDPSTSLSVDEFDEYGFATKQFYVDFLGQEELLSSQILSDYNPFDASSGVAVINDYGSFSAVADDIIREYEGNLVYDVQSAVRTLGEQADGSALDNKLILDITGQTEFGQDLEHPNRLLNDLSADYDGETTNVSLYNKLGDYKYHTHLEDRRQVGIVHGVDSYALNISENSTIGRSYKEAFEEGSFAHNETVAYRVLKYRGNTTNGEPLQDIWLANPNTTNDLEYIDSQVRYGEEYTYAVYAYKYVYGTKYRYIEVSPPTEQRVTREIDPAGEEVIGYNLTWFGARNLFDTIPSSGRVAWQEVKFYIETTDISTQDPDWTRYVGGTFDGAYDLGNVANNDATDTFYIYNILLDPNWVPIITSAYQTISGTSYTNNWPAWTEGTTRFFTLQQINDLMRDAWYTTPTGLDGFTKVTYQSWYEMWGNLDWDDKWLLEDGPGSGLPDRVRSILRGQYFAYDIVSDPKVFSIKDWFNLFMGHDDGGPGFNLFLPGIASAGNIPPQPMPPSHHRVSGINIITAPGTDGRPNDSGPRKILFPAGSTIPSGYQGKAYVGLESVGSTEDFTTNQIVAGLTALSAGTYEGVFHDVGMGIEELEAGAGLPIVELNGYGAEYKVEMYPSTRIVQVPYTQKTITVLSKPPPRPEVSIIPYRAVNDNLLFSFQANVTPVEQIPVPIEPKDVDLFEKHRVAQGKSIGQSITFESDDIPSFFQVYRTDKAPSNYLDFAGKLRASVSTLIPDPEKIIRTTSNSYVDVLRPNVKYYYTFRTMDSHNNVSNPTVVYEVELVDDAGAVYPIIQSYEFPMVSDKVASIPMKRFIQVIPRLEQVTANTVDNLIDFAGQNIDDTQSDYNSNYGKAYEDPSDIPFDSVLLGSKEIEDPIWDKVFKIRLTSKKTGKKIDFNITFKKQDERKVT